MANKVFLNKDDILEVNVVGDQTVQSIVAMGVAITQLVDSLVQAGKPVIILDRIDEIGKVPPEGSRLVIELAKVIPYDRLAMVGSSNVILKAGSTFILHATGKADKVKYFDNYAEATRWLKTFSKDTKKRAP